MPVSLDIDAAPFTALGIGFGFLGLAFVSIGAYRDRAVIRHLAEGRFEPLDSRVVWSVTAVLVVLGAVSISLLLFER